MKNTGIYFLMLFLFPLCSIAQEVQGKEKPVLHAPIAKPANVCSISNTDTIEYAQHRAFKAAFSRIAANQLSVNFSALYYDYFPTKSLTNNVHIVFQLAISKEGQITEVSLIRSPFNAEENTKLKEIVQLVTEDTWHPASYKGNAIDSECTLPITIFKKE